MKKTALVFLGGILVGALLFGGTLVFAADGVKNVLVKYSNIKMVVNGKLVQSQFEPFTYNDRVFVPLRAIGEALSMQVGWEDNTVIVASGNGAKTLSLQDLFVPTVNGTKLSANSKMTVNEKSYTGGFYLSPTNKTEAVCKFTTAFSGLKQVTGSVALDDENKSDDPVDVTILVDGKKVEKFEAVKGELKPVTINAAGVNEIVFLIENGDGKKVDFLDMKLKY